MMEGKCETHRWWKIGARILIAAIFIYAGYGKIAGIEKTVGAIEGVMGWPYPVFFAWVAALIEFVGGILIAVGYYKRYAAWVLIGFTLIATYYFHLMGDKGALTGDVMQITQTLKNLGLVGALLLLAGCGRCGACGNCGGSTCKDCDSACKDGKCETHG